MATTELNPDICVIGAGAGGLAASAAAAAMGVPVVLIEKGLMGGESVAGGAVPSKALLTAAGCAHALSDGARFGVKSVRSGIDFAGVIAHVRHAVATVAPFGSRERFTGLGVRIIAGSAQFVDRRTVVAGDVAVRARRFIIATGSAPIIPAIPGLADTPYFTTRTIFDLPECPRHLIILGAGRLGIELAQAYRRLGADVTVLDAATPLRHEDPECAAIVLDALNREGITLRSGVQIAQIHRVLARVQVVLAKPEGTAEEEQTIEGTHLLITAGRRPNIDGLDLAAARIRHRPEGIVVNKHLRTSNRYVYAIGDVTGGPKFTHVASHQAGLVVRNALFRIPVRFNPRAVPWITYTDPELAQVGMLEDEARARVRVIRVLRWPYRENDRAVTTGEVAGHIKIITDRNGQVLGATIVGAQASENIAAWALAISQRLNIAAFAGLMVPYPTYSEVGKRAAITYFMRGLTSARVRRIIGWLRRLG